MKLGEGKVLSLSKSFKKSDSEVEEENSGSRQGVMGGFTFEDTESEHV